jgi:hypothetical protein
MGWSRGLLVPRPSLFDILVSGFLLAPYIERGTMQEVFFVFYVFMLWSVSLMIKPQRRYASIPLSLICLWSLIGVFVHSFSVSEDSFTRRYLTLYLMGEGFIFILAGCVLIHLFVNYTRNIKFTKILLLVSAIPVVAGYLGKQQMTFALAFAIGWIVYLAIRKQWKWVLGMVGVLVVFCVLNWWFVVSKFGCRPLVWGLMVKDIVKHPFVGSGFLQVLGFENMRYVIKENHMGWTYNHNDFLSFTAFLGLPALVALGWFTVATLKRTVNSIAIIPAIGLILLCSFQMTMFEIGKASIILVMLSLIILHTIKEGERCVV